MARTRRYKPEQVIQALREMNGFISYAAQRLGCSAPVVREYISKYPEIAEALKEIKESMKDTGELSLLNQVQRGDMGAIRYYLSSQAKDRGYGEKIDINANINWRSELQEQGLNPDAVLAALTATLAASLREADRGSVDLGEDTSGTGEDAGVADGIP